MPVQIRSDRAGTATAWPARGLPPSSAPQRLPGQPRSCAVRRTAPGLPAALDPGPHAVAL